jgi:hypothetical protein
MVEDMVAAWCTPREQLEGKIELLMQMVEDLRKVVLAQDERLASIEARLEPPPPPYNPLAIYRDVMADETPAPPAWEPPKRRWWHR